MDEKIRNIVPRLLRKIKKHCIRDDKNRYWCHIDKVIEICPDRPWLEFDDDYWCCWYKENECPEIGDVMTIGRSKYMIEECIMMGENRKNQKLPTKALVNFRRINM